MRQQLLLCLSICTFLCAQRPVFLEVPNALDCYPCNQCATLCNELEEEMNGKVIVISGHMKYHPPIDWWGTPGTQWRNKQTGARTRKPVLNGNLIVDGDTISGQLQTFNPQKVKDSLQIVIDSLYENSDELLEIDIKMLGSSDKSSKIQCTFTPRNGLTFHDSLQFILFITSDTMNHKEDYYKKHPWAREIYSVVRKVLPENSVDTIRPFGQLLTSFDDEITLTYTYLDSMTEKDKSEMTCVAIVEDLRTKEVIAAKEYNGTIWDGPSPVVKATNEYSPLFELKATTLSLLPQSQQAIVKVYSSKGQVVFQMDLKSGESINFRHVLSDLSHQVYFGNVESENVTQSFKIDGTRK